MTTTDDINKGSLDYNAAINEQLRVILKPIFEHFGFTHFAHTKYFDGDRYLMVCADAAMGKEFFRSAEDVQLFFQKFNLPKYGKLKVIWDLQKDNEILEHLRNHGYYHGITLFYRGENHIEGWNFAVDQYNEDINHLYTQDSGVLEDCISYIQDATKDLFRHVPEEALAIYLDQKSFEMAAAFESADAISQKQQAFHETIKHKYIFWHKGRTVALTPVEFECLKATAQGLTAKVIARNRGISPRSVESCLDNVKNKFRVSSKIELIEAFNHSIYS